VYSQDSEEYFTDNHINGHFWKMLKFNEKLHYLYGIVDGVSLISTAKPVFDEAHNYSPKVSEGILLSTGRFFVPKGTYDDIVTFLDTYYSDSANLSNPVYTAYSLYLADQKGWENLPKWNEALRELRRTKPAAQQQPSTQ